MHRLGQSFIVITLVAHFAAFRTEPQSELSLGPAEGASEGVGPGPAAQRTGQRFFVVMLVAHVVAFKTEPQSELSSGVA